MRRFLLFGLVLWASLASPTAGQEIDADQEEALLGGIHHNGGYGAPIVAVTSVNGESAILTGGQGGWIINHHVVIRGGGRGLATRHEVMGNGQPADLQMGYGQMSFRFGSF